MGGISHGNCATSRSATKTGVAAATCDPSITTTFTEAEWFSVVKHAQVMENLINKHSEIMDKHDPQKRVGLIVDEWGAWYDVEPGTNPGFLYQQNSLRDAVVAGLHLNPF